MNFMVMTALCNQFGKLNEDFSKCIGDRGQFSGNFEHFRRRHQAICCSVQEADRFLMISNGAIFASHGATLIFVLYSTIFYRDDTVLHDPELAVMYIAWLGFSLLCVAVIAGQAMMLNHKASFHFVQPRIYVTR